MSPAEVYVSTACLGTPDFRQALVDLAEAGIRAVELGAARSVPEEDGEIVAAVRRAGLRCVLHNYFPPPSDAFVLNLASADPDIASSSLGLVRRALELSARLEAPFYSVHAGFAVDPTGFDGTSFVFPRPRAGEQERALERFAERLALALERARELGVGLLVENNLCTPSMLGAVLLARPGEIVALAERLPGLGLLLDTGHLNVAATTLGFDRDELLAATAPLVGAVHVHDNDGRSDTHEPVAPGSWVVAALCRHGLAGLPIVVESRAGDAAVARRERDALVAALGE